MSANNVSLSLGDGIAVIVSETLTLNHNVPRLA
jgi:hypothetical protein